LAAIGARLREDQKGATAVSGAKSLLGNWRALRVAVLAGCAFALLVPSSASASALVYNFDMYTYQVNTYGGARYVNEIPQRYRWLDTPPTSSRISYNACSNYSNYLFNDFGQDTSYRDIKFYPGSGTASWANGACIVLRGRSLGTINFYGHDGSAIY
jgi:hypothetical protein